MLREPAIDLKKQGPMRGLNGERPHVTPYTQKAPLMRLSVARLRRTVMGHLRIEFVKQDLTSYGGLELLRRYVHRIGLGARLRAACAGLEGDYGGARLALLVLSFFYIGARRLDQLRYLAGDPLLAEHRRRPSPNSGASSASTWSANPLYPLETPPPRRHVGLTLVLLSTRRRRTRGDAPRFPHQGGKDHPHTRRLMNYVC